MTTTELAPPPRWVPAQVDYLTQPINTDRVRTSEDEEEFSYLIIWDIKRQMCRAFGIGGWDTFTSTAVLEKIRHAPRATRVNDRTLWTVIYHAKVRLVVKDHEGRATIKEGEGIGAANLYPSLDKAYSSALAKALAAAWKHAAIELGDAFGLCLYDNGSTDPVVRDFAVRPDGWDPDKPNQRIVDLIASDRRVGAEVSYDQLVGPVPVKVSPDVEAFFADTESWTGADIDDRIEQAHELGISDRYAGPTEDGRPLTVDDLILIIGMRRVREQLAQAAAEETAPDDAPPPCSCDPTELATSGQHTDACARGRALIAALDDALPR